MATTMSRFTLAALAVLAGCGQDIDLGNSRPPPAPAPPSTRSAMAACPIQDPALLKAPDACPQPLEQPLGVAASCVVTADGPARPMGNELVAVPDCPTGVYFTLTDPLPPAENIERAALVLKGVDDYKPAFTGESGTPFPRTVELFPDRRSIFVRLDPRPSDGLRINVVLVYGELYRGIAGHPGGGLVYGYIVGFHAGTRIP
jgi:hypothetical protein